MASSISKRKIKTIIGVLIVFIGICLLSSTYLKQKKFQVFDEMNELYYEQLVEIENIEEIEEEMPIIEVEEQPPIEVSPVVETPKVTSPPIDYTKYYVGYLSIPKLDLRKGFTEIDNKYNNVNRNIQVMKPSDYPDVEKGNFIIAGHSGSSAVSFFKDLYKLVLGDEIFVTYKDREYKYVIKNIYTDLKDGDVVVRRNKNTTTLTLITCTKGDKTTQTIYICEKVN
ncbi:MAG: sortase [Mollicutes bacterium]|nr:sortase [Mollicutes bacterium]